VEVLEILLYKEALKNVDSSSLFYLIEFQLTIIYYLSIIKKWYEEFLIIYLFLH
jgi:hypothetical protein